MKTIVTSSVPVPRPGAIAPRPAARAGGYAQPQATRLRRRPGARTPLMSDGESAKAAMERIEDGVDIANAERAGVEAGLRLLRNERAMSGLPA